MIKKITSVEEIQDFAWALSKDSSTASYPRRNSLESIKKEIQSSITSDVDESIACYRNDTLYGICTYFWNPKDKSAQTVLFLIKEDYNTVADEIIEYIGNKLKGYELLLGFPTSNEMANSYFEKNKIECVESSIVTNIYNLQSPSVEIPKSIEVITEDNFHEYEAFHDKFAIPYEIYWTANNLKRALNRFQILVYKEDGMIKGSIFASANKDIADIVGLLIDEENRDKGIEKILIDSFLQHLYDTFGSIKEILFFIDSNSSNELGCAISAGFKEKENYKCYQYIF